MLRSPRSASSRADAVDLSERLHDIRHDVPVPFASDPNSGYAVDPGKPHERVDLGGVVKARAIQCALSRVCALCGRSLAGPGAGPTTFLGTAQEAESGTFRFPPLHPVCVDFALDTYPALGVPVLGQPLVVHEWTVVETGGFELERPAERGAPVLFHPNAVTSTRVVPVG